MATQERYHVGIDVHDYEKNTHGRKELYFYASPYPESYDEEDWVSAAEYAIELVQSQHPLASVELAYVKEFCV